MSKSLTPFDESECAIMGFQNPKAYFELLDIVDTKVSEPNKSYIINTSQRIFDSKWISRNVAHEIQQGLRIGFHEGLLSISLYLLLTCADTLGHIYATGGVRQRFNSFFNNLTVPVQKNLMSSIEVWKTTSQQMINLGLQGTNSGEFYYPSHSTIVSVLASISDADRFETLVSYLYLRRNSSTHEAEVPQLGFHPNLSVLMAKRLGVSNVASSGDYDHLQVMEDSSNLYFVYFVDDPIHALRWAILKGLGQIFQMYNVP